MLPYVADRWSYEEAVSLMARFGDDAGFEAAARADISRDRGNVRNFCRWRQIERLIVHLSSADAPTVLH